MSIGDLAKLPENYKRIALHETDGFSISTVWLGSDHRYGDGPPLIFESLVQGLNHPLDQHIERYSTEDEAREGHARLVSQGAFYKRLHALVTEEVQELVPSMVQRVLHELFSAGWLSAGDGS